MSLKNELKEVREGGLKSSKEEDTTVGQEKRFYVKNVALRVDTDKGMLWNAKVEFYADSSEEILDALTDLYNGGILDTRKKEPANNYHKSNGLKS